MIFSNLIDLEFAFFFLRVSSRLIRNITGSKRRDQNLTHFLPQTLIKFHGHLSPLMMLQPVTLTQTDFYSGP
jgi:hypothetical protein